MLFLRQEIKHYFTVATLLFQFCLKYQFVMIENLPCNLKSAKEQY